MDYVFISLNQLKQFEKLLKPRQRGSISRRYSQQMAQFVNGIIGEMREALHDKLSVSFTIDGRLLKILFNITVNRKADRSFKDVIPIHTIGSPD